MTLGLRARREDPLDCAGVQRVLQAFVDGELRDEDITRVRAHLDRCRECGIERQLVEQVKAAIRQLRRPVPADSRRRLEDFVDRLDQTARP